MTKTREDMKRFENTLENALMELWAHGTAGATKVHVMNVGWVESLNLPDGWAVTLGNVDHRTESILMENLKVLIRQTEFGKDEIDVYSEWADESSAQHENVTGLA